MAMRQIAVRWALALGLGCGVLSAVAADSALAQAYRLQPGDVIEIGVAGVSDLSRRLTVGLDGKVSLPLYGPLDVNGLTIAELRSRVQDILSTKALRQRTIDGREFAILIGRDEVTADIAEYVPVYVTGDVARPSEVRYRPGMSVIQAVSLAGGFDAARLRGNGLLTQAVDLRADFEALSSELATQQARVTSLQAELDGKSELKKEDLPELPSGNQMGEANNTLELQRFKVRRDDLEKERAFLQQAVGKADSELSLLTDQLKRESEGVEIDTADFNNAQELFKKGTVPIGRVTDARRAVLLSSTRLLQTNVRLAEVAREREDASRRLQRLDDERRTLALTELQQATLQVATLKSRLEAVSQKAISVGAARQAIGEKAAQPEYYIIRKSGDGTRVAVNESTELLPGDVVDVTIPIDPLFVEVGQRAPMP